MIFAVTFQAFPVCGTPPPPAWKRYSAAAINPPALARGVQIQGLVALYSRVLRVFLTDDSEDLSATMKALDKEMADAERWALGINDLCDGLADPQKIFDGFKRAANSAASTTRKAAERAAGGDPDGKDGPIIDGDASQAS